MVYHKAIRPFVWLSAALSTQVMADAFTLNGFFSTGMAMLDREGVEYFEDSNNEEKITDKPNFNYDTVLGLQASAQISERARIIGQWVSRGAYDQYQVSTEWALLAYQVTDELLFRAGRLRSPVYHYSDYLEVGFTYPWMRPPGELYWQIPFTAMDGVNLLFQTSVGEYDFAGELLAGSSNPELFFEYDVTDMYATVFSVARGPVSFRVIGAWSKTSSADYNEANDAYNQSLNQLFTAVGDGRQDILVMDEQDGSYLGLSLSVDYENWLAVSEWGRRKIDGVLQDPIGYYLMVGYRWGSWMPHFTYARMTQADEQAWHVVTPEIEAALTFTGQAEQLAQLQAMDQALDDWFNVQNESYILGVRKEIGDSLDVKLEITRTTAINDSVGFYSKRPAEGSETSHIFSLGIDAVF